MKRRFDGYYWVVMGPEVREHALVARTKAGYSLGWLHEHKYVLYEKIGPGSHPCFYCGKIVHWVGKPQLQVDHVDDDRDNNAPENLVPSCVRCNTRRSDKYPTTEQLVAQNNVEQTCSRCGKKCPTVASLRGHSAWCGEERRQKMIEAFKKRPILKRNPEGRYTSGK